MNSFTQFGLHILKFVSPLDTKIGKETENYFLVPSPFVFLWSSQDSGVECFVYFSFTDTNPLQLRNLKVYLPFDIKSGTVVANVTVTGQLASLVQPFIFYINNVTQRGKQSPGSFKRRRRRDIVDVCEEAGTIVPLNYFCIQRLSGQIKVTQDFVFKNGDEFDLKIRVTDSDQWGKTENSANFKFISRDECKDIRVIYKEAVTFCSAVSPANGQKSCPSALCLEPLYKWRDAVNASEKLRADCASDTKNMEALLQLYSSCIGKSHRYLQYRVPVLTLPS